MTLDAFREHYRSNFGGIKVAFFDCDGTLSIPCYNVEGEMKVGMPKDDWLPYNISNKDSYKDCIPCQSKNLFWLLDLLKEKGVDMNVLTLEYHSFAYFNKVDFLLMHFGVYFEPRKIHFCSCGGYDKIEVMKAYADVNDLDRSSILFVDDDFGLCLEATEEGFSVLHSSYFS